MSWLLECGGKQHGWDFRCQRQFNTPNTFVNFFFSSPVWYISFNPPDGFNILKSLWGKARTILQRSEHPSSLCCVVWPSRHQDFIGWTRQIWNSIQDTVPQRHENHPEGNRHWLQAPVTCLKLHNTFLPFIQLIIIRDLPTSRKDPQTVFPFFSPEEKNLSKLIFLNI